MGLSRPARGDEDPEEFRGPADVGVVDIALEFAFPFTGTRNGQESGPDRFAITATILALFALDSILLGVRRS